MAANKPNHELWKLFVFLAEGINDMNFLWEHNGAELRIDHTGIGLEDIGIEITKHDYLPMTRITAKINPPAEIMNYLYSGEHLQPAGERIKHYLDTRGEISYLVYNEVMGTVLEELKAVHKALSGEATTNSAKQMVEFLGNLAIADMDKSVSRHENRYYPLIINRLPNLIVGEPTEEWIDNTFGDMMSSDVDHVDFLVERAAKRIANSLKQIAPLVNGWATQTESVKDHDLWFSLNIVEHKIHIGIDRQPYLIVGETDEERTFMIERKAVDFDEAWSPKDLEILAKIQEHVDAMNIQIDNLLNLNTGFEMLNKEKERLYIGKIHHPIAKHTVRVWEFDDVCAEGRAKIDEEIRWILEAVEQAANEAQNEVQLDISNMLLHGKADNQRFILTDENQTVAKRCQTYSGSFFDHLQQHLYDVETPLFGPYTNVTPADLSNEAVVTEEELLTPPTIH